MQEVMQQMKTLERSVTESTRLQPEKKQILNGRSRCTADHHHITATDFRGGSALGNCQCTTPTN